MLRKILGTDKPELIAAGVFLSMPGAEAQNYHTDGVHLNLRNHAPPPAVTFRLRDAAARRCCFATAESFVFSQFTHSQVSRQASPLSKQTQ